VKNFYDVLYTKRITENVEDLPTIYCDMDMVLCDFLKGAEEVLGTSFIKADKTKRWPTISAKKDFWVSLEWMSGSKKMWTFINKYDAHILSAYSTKDANSRKGKLDWLRKNAKLTQRSRIHLVLREDKQKYAMTQDGKPNLLIDDYIKNINEFKARGGIGIHHTSPSNTIAELKKLGFK
tara:strand:+ start:1147 stop:1683 length:537 start_codon:yes stop_codon:yes gene_type:complete